MTLTSFTISILFHCLCGARIRHVRSLSQAFAKLFSRGRQVSVLRAGDAHREDVIDPGQRSIEQSFSAHVFENRERPTLLLSGVGIAVGNALVNPTMSGLVSQTVDKHHQGRVLGSMQSGASLGRCLGPILCGWLVLSNAQHTLDFGKAPFWTSSAILLLSLAVTATVTAPSATLPNSALPGED